MNRLEVPPIIVAPDFIGTEYTRGLLSKLDIIGPEILGVKIPSWHNQDQDLLREVTDQGRFTILETQIHNTAKKMKTMTEAFLSRAVLPSAITVNPSNRASKEGEEILRGFIVPYAHSQNVAVVGYADHNDLPHNEPHFHEKESNRFRDGAKVGFDAFEVHAATAESPYLIAEKGHIEAEPNVSEPLIIVSKITESASPDKPIEVRAQELFARGVQSIYLGESIMSSDNPGKLIEKIAENL